MSYQLARCLYPAYTLLVLIIVTSNVILCCLRLSSLPYDVTPEQALEHAAVRDRIKHSIQILQDTTEYFLSAILESVDKIPYVCTIVLSLYCVYLAL